MRIIRSVLPWLANRMLHFGLRYFDRFRFRFRLVNSQSTTRIFLPICHLPTHPSGHRTLWLAIALLCETANVKYKKKKKIDADNKSLSLYIYMYSERFLFNKVRGWDRGGRKETS